MQKWMMKRKVGEMGMIQIDMPMPKNCIDCPACNEYLMCAIPCNGRGWGENDVKEFSQNRPEWCPMKELVRCKDCKHYTGGLDGYCEKWFRKTGGNMFYCADGEKES